MPPSRRGFTESQHVHTKLSASNYLFFAFTGPMDAFEEFKVRMSIELTHLSGTDITVLAAYQDADNDQDWPASTSCTLLSGSATTEGVAIAATWTDLSGATKKFIRFGVRVRNTAGATLEFGRVAIRLERRAN